MADVKNVKSFSKGAKELKEIITDQVNAIKYPTGVGSQSEIARGILQNVDAQVFDKHNQAGIVEVKATFEASKKVGDKAQHVFTLEIIWDADNPLTSSTQTAHYGWEIYFNGKRVGGPGHVFFEKKLILPHYRLSDVPKVEDTSLRLGKSGTIGSQSQMTSSVVYMKQDK